jgi:hypothetical protein
MQRAMFPAVIELWYAPFGIDRAKAIYRDNPRSSPGNETKYDIEYFRSKNYNP